MPMSFASEAPQKRLDRLCPQKDPGKIQENPGGSQGEALQKAKGLGEGQLEGQKVRRSYPSKNKTAQKALKGESRIALPESHSPPETVALLQAGAPPATSASPGAMS